jgi:predicted alpha/beta-hydrolase family hydrolase
MSRTVSIRWHGGSVSGRWKARRIPSGPAVLLAHGAGTNQDHWGVTRIRDGLAALGHPVLTFNYPYTESSIGRGSGRPDRPAVLLDVHRAALAWLHESHDNVVLAGRSMGGRMATHLAAEKAPVAGVVLYGYPLHPAGKPEKLRVDHLSSVDLPLLFFTGSRDALALPELFDAWLRPLPTATTHIIEEADHSFRIPKRSGFTPETLLDWMVEQTSAWMHDLDRGLD